MKLKDGVLGTPVFRSQRDKDITKKYAQVGLVKQKKIKKNEK